MGADEKPDRPDKLTPAQREQYEGRYIPEKLGRGEIPRPPDKWLEHSAFWRTEWLAGRAFERGADIVFGLPQAGWQTNVPYTTPSGQGINVDRYLQRDDSKDGKPHNLEIKKGDLKARDLLQMAGYKAKLERGEHVTLLMRASKEANLSPQAKQLIESLKKAYPDQFVVKAASEKAFQRIFEAGLKAVQKEQRQRLEQNLSKLPAREVNSLSVEQIAKDYLRDIEKGQVLGQPLGIDQMRFMNEALRDMNQAQTRIEFDQAKEDRQALGLRYHESKAVERFLEGKAADKHIDRSTSIDKITHELLNREREEVAKSAAETLKQIEQAQAQGKTLEVEALKRDHIALGNALGAVRKIESDLCKDIAKDLPKKEAEPWLGRMEMGREERDERIAQRIDSIGAVVDREEKARAAREAHAQEMAAQRQALRDLGVPEQVLKIAGLNQVPMSAEQQDRLRALDEQRLGAPEVSRGGRAAQRDARGREAHGRDVW